MLFFLTILILLSAVAVVVTVSIFLRRQKSRPPSTEIPPQFQTPIQYQSIFVPSDEELRALEAEEKAKQREMLRQKIPAKAETADFNALIEAKDFGGEFYNAILKELAFRCDAEKLVSPGSFIKENKLPTNAEFISRNQSPPRK